MTMNNFQLMYMDRRKRKTTIRPYKTEAHKIGKGKKCIMRTVRFGPHEDIVQERIIDRSFDWMTERAVWLRFRAKRNRRISIGMESIAISIYRPPTLKEEYFDILRKVGDIQKEIARIRTLKEDLIRLADMKKLEVDGLLNEEGLAALHFNEAEALSIGDKMIWLAKRIGKEQALREWELHHGNDYFESVEMFCSEEEVREIRGKWENLP